jgi:hypothetical protein
MVLYKTRMLYYGLKSIKFQQSKSSPLSFPTYTLFWTVSSLPWTLPTSYFTEPTSYFTEPTSYFTESTSNYTEPASYFTKPNSNFTEPISYFTNQTSFTPAPGDSSLRWRSVRNDTYLHSIWE